jgi:drug/metabolite transporter (DMT)-like permease
VTQQTGPGAAEATTPQARLGAIAEALLVTVLWSSSWVLIKIGLGDLPPLVFAGLRYTPATVNTAFAFTLWNRSLRHLTATESSVINNTMMIQIALLAWLVLGEALSLREAFGLAVAAVGVLVVQLRR